MKTLTFRIKIINFFKFFADALYTPFLILFFKSVGYQGFQLGVLLGIVPLMTILGNIILSFIANNFKRNKLILCLLLLMYGLGLFLLIYSSEKFVFSLIAVTLISLSNGPSFNLEESISSSYTESEHKNYSFTRLFGSLGYFAALLIIYFLPNNIKYKNLFFLSGIIFFILSAVWIFMPNLNETSKEKASVKELIFNKEYCAYFLMYFLFFGAFNAFDYYIPDFVKSISFTENEWSLLYACAVLLEILVIPLIGKFVKEKYYKCTLLFALLFLLIRSGLFIIPNLSKYFVAILVVIRGIGWGSFLAIHIKLLMTLIKSNAKSTGILLLCIGQGMIAAALNFFGDTIIQNSSYNVFFLIITICMAVSFIFYLVYNLVSFVKRRG